MGPFGPRGSIEVIRVSSTYKHLRLAEQTARDRDKDAKEKDMIQRLRRLPLTGQKKAHVTSLAKSYYDDFGYLSENNWILVKLYIARYKNV